MKLAFGIPWSSPFVWTEYHDAMLNLARPTEARNALGILEPIETRFFRGRGWCPARRHTDLCEQALEWDADLICVLGADQIHPEDTLLRLVDRWNEGCEVVAALVPARGYIGWQPMKPFQPMAWRVQRTNGTRLESVLDLHKTKNEIDVIDPSDGDIQNVNFIGSGVLLFHRDHLLALKRPWFNETINPETYERLASMDTVFVWRLQSEAQAKVWVDTTIKVRHLHPFQIDESYSERFADWATPGIGDPNVCRYQTNEPLEEKTHVG